jgi:hypothetical protein
MRYSVDEVEEAASRAAFRIAENEHRLTSLELGHMSHGRRLDQLEQEQDAQNAAIWKAVRGLALLCAGVAVDLKLNGGGLLRTFFGG